MAIDRVAGAAFRPITEVLRERTESLGNQQVPQTGPTSFSERLTSALSEVEGTLGGADAAISALASGENVDLHGSMVALEKADIAMRMTVSARDKFIAAYEQIMNMSL